MILGNNAARMLGAVALAALMAGCAREPSPYKPHATYTDAAINAQLTRTFGRRIATLGLRHIGTLATYDDAYESLLTSCLNQNYDVGDNECYDTKLVATLAGRAKFVYRWEEFDGSAGFDGKAAVAPMQLKFDQLRDIQVTMDAKGLQFHMPVEWRRDLSREDALRTAEVALDELLIPLERDRTWSVPVKSVAVLAP